MNYSDGIITLPILTSFHCHTPEEAAQCYTDLTFEKGRIGAEREKQQVDDAPPETHPLVPVQYA